MSDMERLALAQALYKYLGKIVSTRDDGSLRSQMSRELLEQYAKDGTDRKRMMLNGIKVGTLSVTQGQPVERLVANVTDEGQLLEWGADDLVAYIKGRGLVEDFALWSREQGYGPASIPGVTYTTVAEQAPPRTMLHGCDQEDVAAALGDGLPAAVMGLIGDGDE